MRRLLPLLLALAPLWASAQLSTVTTIAGRGGNFGGGCTRPDVNNVSPSTFEDLDTGISITGTCFGASETGSATVKICSTDNIGGTCATQDATSWSANTIAFTVEQGAFGDIGAFLFVTDLNGLSNQNGFPVTFSGAPPAGISLLWDDWATWREGNGPANGTPCLAPESTKIFCNYNAGAGDGGPSQTDIGVSGNKMRITVPSNNIFYAHHFASPCTSYPSRWWSGHIKSGTFNAADPPNRITFGFVSGLSHSSGAPSDNFNFATYMKATNNFDPSTNTGGCEDNNNHHYFGLGFPATANVPIRIVATNRPDHQRGGSTSTNYTPIADFYVRLTRFYITDWLPGTHGGTTYEVFPIESWDQDDVASEDDTNIGISSSQYTGSQYVVTFAARANIEDVFDVRYTSNGTSLHDIGFTNGTSGGQVTAPGTTYTTVTWTLSTSEFSGGAEPGLHVGFRKTGETLFREVYHPFQYSPTNTGAP